MKNVYILSLVLFLIIAIGSLKVYSTDGSCCRDGELPQRISWPVSNILGGSSGDSSGDSSEDSSGDSSGDSSDDQEEDQPMVFALDKACMKAYLRNLDVYATPSDLSDVVKNNIKNAAYSCSEKMQQAYEANSSSFDFDPRVVSNSATSDTVSCVTNVYDKVYSINKSPTRDCQFISYAWWEYQKKHNSVPDKFYDFEPFFYIIVDTMVDYFGTKYEEHGGKVIETNKANFPPGTVVY